MEAVEDFNLTRFSAGFQRDSTATAMITASNIDAAGPALVQNDFAGAARGRTIRRGGA